MTTIKGFLPQLEPKYSNLRENEGETSPLHSSIYTPKEMLNFD